MYFKCSLSDKSYVGWLDLKKNSLRGDVWCVLDDFNFIFPFVDRAGVGVSSIEFSKFYLLDGIFRFASSREKVHLVLAQWRIVGMIDCILISNEWWDH